MSAIDAYFMGVSASTESGLNVVDLNGLKLYQQLYLYFATVFTQMGLRSDCPRTAGILGYDRYSDAALKGPAILRARRRQGADEGSQLEYGEPEGSSPATRRGVDNDISISDERGEKSGEQLAAAKDCLMKKPFPNSESKGSGSRSSSVEDEGDTSGRHVENDISTNKYAHPRSDTALYVTGPRDRELGHPHPLIELTSPRSAEASEHGEADILGQSRSVGRAAGIASSLFVLGRRPTNPPIPGELPRLRRAPDDMPYLSGDATVGRNSRFHNLTRQDRDKLGGIEYRSLKLLLKVVVGKLFSLAHLSYYFGVHLLGAIGLIAWILHADAKYASHLDGFAQDKTWWAFYTSQTAVCNLGFTLTPDSMVFFQDSQWVMFWLTLLTFAGNTLYPVFLRCILWTMSKTTTPTPTTRGSSAHESLRFLLAHPRRCYTLLFPRGTTWALFGIIVGLSFLGALILLVLDLHNPEFTRLTPAQRVAAALFQSTAARHTGATAFVLSNLSPGAQFTLLVMMYISTFPVAVSIRSSNIYEEKSLGYYPRDPTYNEDRGASYLLRHMQKQLGFDLWYIFLGLFCLSVSEAGKLADPDQPAFSFFAVFFEVVSA
ncbi:hypothetical protein ED733_008477 [Metarhizium rileyi]|uniref:Cation transporter n=1 Tax=Metarhizium rileyi (strain RCEF 4871) TaxID=1649241 RepID=A0A5C6GL21_METRR|nr:hypothetical protein ED733_008477 [Metarhizium rileyi]